jgi:hypothetical protein
MNNDGCPGNGWSIISSAPTNSQLAGVLAGFVFTGVIILFSRPGPKNTQAVGLFSATFVVLAFDSYLFSLVSGGNTDRVCTRVWSEAMAASGMLGAGGVGLIGSIAWLLAHYDSDTAGDVDRSQTGATATIALDRLSRVMLFGVAVAVALLLAATSSDYLDIIFDRHTPRWLTWITLCSPVAVGLVAWILLTQRARRRRRTKPRASSDIESTHTLSHVAFGMLAYAVIGPVYAGVLTNLPEGVWTTPAIAIGGVTLLVGLVVPAIILVMVVLSAPPIVRVSANLKTPDDDENLSGIGDH